MIRFNIACGPSMFPGWHNIDRVDQGEFLRAMAAAADTSGWPEWQQRLAQAAQERRVGYTVDDLRDGFGGINDNWIDAVYGGQMIEHLNPLYEVPKFLAECHRILRPGGVIRLTTPDLSRLLHLREYYPNDLLELARELPEPLNTGTPDDVLCYLMFGSAGPDCTYDNYEGHMHLYTPLTLGQRLAVAGFVDIKSQPANVTDYPELLEGFVDLGMRYGFALEARKP